MGTGSPARCAAIIGTGLIGQGWAIVFARKGWDVRLYDVNAAMLAEARSLILQQLRELETQGLLEDANGIIERVHVAGSLADAVKGASYIQENSPEKVEIKRALFTELDAVAEPDAVIGSSTSSIPASQFTEHLPGRHRCLVAHPVNPPYLIPVVELCPAPWTSPQALNAAREAMTAIGQKPVLVRREIEGFILNRLQSALLHEAFRLAKAGIASAEDIDVTVKDGLGLRWSFMGPFETIDLNAPGGIADYCARYGGLYESIGADQGECVAWDGALVAALEDERRGLLPEEDLAKRRFWRDEKLMRLMRHKQENGDNNG
ncbi:3-hydroxyacyl-CoA dehydrogenase [Achromobacter marplatensis]|jgi:3-hydroxyacyl-CoA dehydrogenase|uniref:3-hydroxyacyl-CoA dehydrogenase n=1 Tax=Achromobacter marplatensis TaxID=470868 RepID=A0AA42WDY9_9BURK|nr:3-hydroxyacyl-CoA dehydrogenase [Achromobacter marplatensis]EJO27818.1 3-hydroxyacyl-CoA dehydrogenase, C-terminal domain-containing protein 4 [Achromobacter marplatensis]MDH2052481.1 3-hydroxyacyl-CoA dehydrogenase [Achromobacter marplatensis]